MILPYLAIVLLVITTAYSAIVSFRHRPEGAVPSWIFPIGTSRAARILVGLTTLALVVGLGAWFGISARSSTRGSLRFLIPEGYTGWVRVEFEVEGAPPFPVGAGQAVLKIPPSGLLRTSSPEPLGTTDYYYSYSGSSSRPIPDSGSGRLIWGKIDGEDSGASGKRKYEEFFVGTEQQFKSRAGEESVGR